MNIRAIEEKDYYDVELVSKMAFWNLNMPGCDEHYLAHRIWTNEDYLPDISLLAEVDGKIVGAILYLKAIIKCEGKQINTLTFGPLAVHPQYQKQGIGRVLLEKSMELAKAEGYSSVFITGVPAYYPKFGFKTADNFGVTMPDGANFDAFMGIELINGALTGVSGQFYEPSVYDCDVHNEEYMKLVEEYDGLFPKMKKEILATQWR